MSGVVSKQRVAGLDGLRAIAAMMVFLEHRTPLGILHIGGYGVRLFFVLSGYLIIGRIVRDFDVVDAVPRSASIRRFFINRAFRILPIYWLTLSGFAIALAIGATASVSWKEIEWHAAFAGNIYAGQVVGHWSRSLSHLWSLAVEEQFYLTIAPLIIMSGRRWYFAICAALVGAAIMQECHLVWAGAPEIRIVTDSIIGFGMIALGGCLCRLAPKEGLMTDAFALALLTAYLTLPVILFRWSAAPAWLSMMTVPIAAWLIIGIRSRPSSLLVLILETKPLASFGRVSYGFYIYHYWLTSEALHKVTLGAIDIRSAPNTIQAISLFFATLALSIFSWFIVEKPLLALRTRATARKYIRRAPSLLERYPAVA